MAQGVSTEWEDIHVKLGNYLPREKGPTNNEIEQIAIDAVENYNPLEKKTLEELNELEESDDEDEVIKAYKEKRMQEMKEYSEKVKFGKVFELRKQDYIAEVTNAPKDVFVVLLLYQTYVENSNILSNIFDSLANKFQLVKFLRIVATNCIEKYSDDDVPGVIIYQNAKLIRQFIPASHYFGGKHLSWKKVEWILSSLGVVKTTLQDDPFDEYEPMKIFTPKSKKPARDDESDEEERDEKEYYWKINKK